MFKSEYKFDVINVLTYLGQKVFLKDTLHMFMNVPSQKMKNLNVITVVIRQIRNFIKHSHEMITWNITKIIKTLMKRFS